MNLNAALEEETYDAEILPAVAPTLSLAVVKPQFARYVAATERMVLDASAINIQDEESLKFAVALGGEAKKIVKAINTKKADVTAEPNEFVKSVGGFCKMFTDKLAIVEVTLKQKITAYQSQIELERRRQEEAARKVAAEMQARLDAEAAEMNRKAREEAAKKAGEEARARLAAEAANRKEAESKKEAEARAKKEAEEIEAAKKAAEAEAAKHEIQAPQLPDMIIPKQESVTRTETGTSSYQVKTWKCYVQSPDLVPREYCVPDGRLLNQAVKQGVREIPGCKIEEVSDTRFRS